MYSILSFALICSCLCLFIWSGSERVFYGEFRVLPVLNVTQFVNSGVLDEEGAVMLEGAFEFSD